ncbi:mediator of RNA polymerase II transcription subunit [Yamadazyma tenuis]|uniref:Mediator of RNA polymerase II transcription subunit 20 n=1 Tax=Candida tenuis (strain ATCC 10573 / BCRC 21748 / CBS 615 / JCM 9827 / NBRC 10315 / NRRL Y-1498 / VKM Y-70) TaxID=590646 RepID=G3B0I0_CANTC|nr:mediator of RNA polymerase II transcription subunit 20 [Yamadazyma tenuis ATCC 10573]XP_006685262.1 uncharacterized protein CANTEDRAFT_133710 [Yamadazyma tenuis ATCC 10573]EGV65575.1 mediator of RNA polymerase II transcription subunit 20 [Yamadazyma tenuis ATCC 10573]EGV65576.1 hypothetical protein CANTEDRAFT_133710 [Yamadazyma tenuis ATCC 10573]WEJ94923.1 mediator of RNA polymerase II transcription subunit [Yamadazyma tenuis]
MVSAVILNSGANPESITQFHDELANELPELRGNWGFSFKIFRNNPYSIPSGQPDSEEVSKETRFLHTLSPSYMNDLCICLINRRSVSVFTNMIDEEIGDLKFDTQIMTIPNGHLHKGAATGLSDVFDKFAAQKLQSLWTLKQNVRGDGGSIYQLENGNLTIKTSNVFLHGIFKGLLVEVNVDDHIVESTSSEYLVELFDRIIIDYKIPKGKMCFELMDSENPDELGDLCFQYSEILNF